MKSVSQFGLDGRSGRQLRTLLVVIAQCFFGHAFLARAAPSTVSPEAGYDLGEFPHPESVALAGARNALGESTVAVFNNPANLATSRAFHLQAIGAYSPEARRQSYGAVVTDSVTSSVAGGLGGGWSRLDPGGINRTSIDLRLSLAYAFAKAVAIGATGRYLHVNQAVGSGPFGMSAASGGTPGGAVASLPTFDVGATVIPTSFLRIGVVGHNIMTPKAHNAFAPLTVAGGLALMAAPLTLEAGGLFDFTTWGSPKGRAMVGAEVVLVDKIPLRVGYRYDEGMNLHSLTAGVGYKGERWSIEASGRRDVGTPVAMTMLSFGMTYFFEVGDGF